MKDSSPSSPQGKSANKTNVRSARRFPWTKEEDALLGKSPDAEVAHKLNRTVAGVRDRRSFLGKPAFGHGPQAFWTEREPGEIAGLFGRKSDRELQALLGWRYQRIRAWRRRLGGGRAGKGRPEWTLEEDRLLGTKPDRVLARKFGRSVAAVRARRGRKRIRLLKKWRPEDDKILGTRSDREVALLLGRTVSNVSWRRARLGIAPKAKPRAWTPEEEALLGSKPDRELADKFERTVLAVSARREALGRPKPDALFKVVKVAFAPGRGGKRKPAYCTWTPEEDTLLGQLTDEEVGRKLGYSVARVQRRRRRLGRGGNNPNHRLWTDQEMALLGTRPDREVARLVNRSIGNVQYKRLKLGIPFCNTHYEVWKPEEVALLGKVPDKEVVARTGHSLLSVRQARTKRHILSVRRAAPEWRPEEEALLGTKPDQELAAELRRTVAAVRLRRVRKGLLPWTAGGGSVRIELGRTGPGLVPEQ